MKFGFVAKHRAIWPVSWICETLGVSRSGFNAWLNRSPSKRALDDVVVLAGIRSSFAGSDRTPAFAGAGSMVLVGSGMTFLPMVWMPDCIASSG